MSKSDLGDLLGFSPASKTVDKVWNLLWQLWERQEVHGGDLLRLCFGCNRVPEEFDERL